MFWKSFYEDDIQPEKQEASPGPTLGCLAENSSIFWTNFSRRSQNLIFLLTVGSKELNHAATEDLKNGRRGVRRGFWPPDIPILPFQVSVPPSWLPLGKKHLILPSEGIRHDLFRRKGPKVIGFTVVICDASYWNPPRSLAQPPPDLVNSYCQ